jgi:hypothetical protein
MNAALGGVSAGGKGTPLFEVSHSGGAPSAFVANQSVGNTGGVTPSKFSLNVTRPEHGGHELPPEFCATTGETAMANGDIFAAATPELAAFHCASANEIAARGTTRST